MKRIYIAGPMTGLQDLNRVEFEKAFLTIRDKYSGLVEIVNPRGVADYLKWDQSTSLSWIAGVLMPELVQCDAIYMLRGWEQSKGATAEHAVAKWIGLELIYQGEAE